MKQAYDPRQLMISFGQHVHNRDGRGDAEQVAERGPGNETV